MTLNFLRGALATLLVSAAALSGCGGSSDNKNATLTLVNATADVPNVNILLNSTQQFGNVGINGQSASASVGAATYTVDLTSGTSPTVLLTSSRSLGADTDYMAVAWGSASALRLALLSDSVGSADAPLTGVAALRVFNTAVDAGALDVYLTASSTVLDGVSANVSSITSGTLGSYAQISQGSYRLRVTAAGDKTDVRLDLPNITLANQTRVTLVLQPGSGGVLVNALQLVYQNTSPTVLANTQARARVVASVNNNGTVTASLGGTSLNVGLRSPSVGSYVLVPAGSQAMSVTVNGSLALGGTQAVQAGADYTLLVSGNPASPNLAMIADDNRFPTSATRAKVRLIDGALGQDGLTLAVDFTAVASNVAYGTASAFGTAAANTASDIEVTSPLLSAPLYSTATTPINLQALGVYTVFLLGGNSAPTGVLRKDR